ncbi:TraB/GumN family protein [Dinghuibacter silviterrae]|uniref:TraB family protein n=1 Tax=Dinghuibacter silviterrae TaxID=1539049 RepID=A0A4V3GKQ1_9BACT|nr:TraB/GumN family protein [Dinghuibacter silviterrae]TDW96532.1 hypothetical protein EDB95_4363 [Dinghuibacter silviterrae]
MYRLLLFLLSALLAVSPGAKAQQNSLLWEISGRGLLHPSYLFGTIHMICPDDFFLTPAMKSTFEKAHTVYLEINLDDPSAPMKLMGMIQYKDGRKLSDFFDSADYKDLGRFVKDSMKMDVHFFEKFKPLMLYSMMSAKMLPCAKEQAYETEFVEMARDRNKPIRGLETMEEQVSIFDSIPGKIQAGMIMDMVRHYDSQKLDFHRMVAFYKAQEVDSLYQMLQESPDTKIDQDLLLNRRNRKWVPLIGAAIRQGPCFIAVGAGHLGGPQGLLSLLRRQGYTVKPVQ